ncbi:unnamed protein product [Rhodiola kirilowii]
MHPQTAFLSTLVIFSLLFQGYGRELGDAAAVKAEEIRNRSREMIEVMDYSDPGANTNLKNGFQVSPPSPPAPPPHGF